MHVSLVLPIGMLFGITAWSLVFLWYVHPNLSARSLAETLRPLLLLHVFRYVGLIFLVPGATALPLDAWFAGPAAYGDLVAALLALLTLAALHTGHRATRALAWLFNAWGVVDLLNAVARGLMLSLDGALGAAFWIPLVIVPLLLVSHAYMFFRLGQELPVRRRPHAA